MRTLYLGLLATIALTACGADEPPEILARWRHTSTMDLAPPAAGPERRVIVAQRTNPAELVTLQEETGGVLEGPHAVFPTTHAPAVVGTNIYLVTTVGRIVHTDLAGQVLPAPDVMLGATSPIVAAADGTLRVVANAGRLVGFDDAGSILLDVNVGGASATAPAVDEDGNTYVATDTGSLVGYDAGGAQIFDAPLVGQGSGPSARGQVVAVGDADGVKAFSANGAEIFAHPRAARVTGTRILANGEILAWGEDGAVELLDGSGALIMSYAAGPPIYTEVVAIDDAAERFVVIDDSGVAHLVGRDGAAVTTFALGARALLQVARAASSPFVFVTVGREVIALDFTSRT